MMENNILIASLGNSQSHSSHSGHCTLASTWLRQLLLTSVEEKEAAIASRSNGSNVRASCMLPSMYCSWINVFVF